MENSRLKIIKWLTLLLFVAFGQFIFAQDRSAEEHVRKLYEGVTFRPNDLPDWDNIKSMFIEDAIITLRASKEKVSVFTVDQWVQDFVDFIENRKLANIGFNENIAKLSALQFGDMAHVLVLYEPRIPGIESDRQGVDSIHLIRQDDQWKIVSILNELPSNGRTIPKALID